MPPLAIKDLVLHTITQIAPEANLDRLDPDVRFRGQFNFDSVDLVNLVEKLKESLHCKIPEIDYPQLTTLIGVVFPTWKDCQILDQSGNNFFSTTV